MNIDQITQIVENTIKNKSYSVEQVRSVTSSLLLAVSPVRKEWGSGCDTGHSFAHHFPVIIPLEDNPTLKKHENGLYVLHGISIGMIDRESVFEDQTDELSFWKKLIISLPMSDGLKYGLLWKNEKFIPYDSHKEYFSMIHPRSLVLSIYTNTR